VRNSLAVHWRLDPDIAFLNHGSFGACPFPVLARQEELRAQMERRPVEFLVRRLPDLLDAARARLAAFLGADPEGLVAVANATTGVNAVLRSLALEPGDELLVTDHEYNACRNALDFVAERAGARVVVVPVPFPVASAGEVVEVVLGAATPRTRLALIDHVTSPTGMVLPVERIVAGLAERGVDTLVDGAHGPGMLALNLESLGAAYYVGNCHKWLCAPKGAGFLHVRGAERRSAVRPVVISHGTNTPRPGRSRFHDEFDWTGTEDPTAFLCVPTAIDFMASRLPGGWPEVMERNHALALQARDILAAALGVAAPCPDDMIGSMAALPLPDGTGDAPSAALYTDPLQDLLIAEHGIEVPVVPWPEPPKRLIRISAQIYNEADEYRRLGDALLRQLA